MRLAILYSHLREFGGAEGVVLKQAELLQSHGHDVSCYFAYVDKSLVKGLADFKPKVESFLEFPVPNIEIFRLISSIPLAPLTLKAFRNVDVLICHGYGPSPWIGFVVKKIRRLKYISYIHSPPRFLYLGTKMKELWSFNRIRHALYSMGSVSGQILRKVDFLGVVNSDAVLVNSVFTARRVKAIYEIQPAVCYPPVDTGIFKPLDQEVVQEMQSEFKLPFILSSGRIVPIKRWEWLLESMAHVKRIYPHVTLAVTGRITRENVHYVQELIKLAESLGIRKNLRFLGFLTQNELVKLYNLADVYAYSVPGEDFGLGPVEAMACGTPAVVWDDGAGPCETVINEKTGFRARPYEVEDFAQKLLKALDMDKLKVSKFSSEFVQKNFSHEKHLRILEETIESI
ncbi:glycosyltransferase family 4 protein [Candidatus Bathyarchaeota archaeon]|nr:glycosyltransferase family 4 protein [Candidatus Bathyarchaeota archaeon]